MHSFRECCTAYRTVRQLKRSPHLCNSIVCGELKVEVYYKTVEFWDWLGVIINFVLALTGGMAIGASFILFQSRPINSVWILVLLSFSLGVFTSAMIAFYRMIGVYFCNHHA